MIIAKIRYNTLHNQNPEDIDGMRADEVFLILLNVDRFFIKLGFAFFCPNIFLLIFEKKELVLFCEEFI